MEEQAVFFFFAGAVRAWSSDGHQYVLFRLTIPTYERISETYLGVTIKHKKQDSKTQNNHNRTTQKTQQDT